MFTADDTTTEIKESHRALSHTAIAGQIRAQIVRGEMAPGERLPTRTELEQRFGTTKTTLQRAFHILIGEGFIMSEGTRGTFVSMRPPHLSRYALVFHGNPSENVTPYFGLALQREAAVIEDRYGIEISILHEVDAHQDSPDYRQLLHDMQAFRLAGVIFAFDIGFIAMTSLLREFNVPMVAIMSTPNELGIPIVKIDYSSFFKEAVVYLAQQGRKRVAAINPTDLAINESQSFFDCVAQHGLETRDFWWLPAHLLDPAAARVYTRLMMNAEQNVRPDAIIISDDNMVEHVLAGLKDAGVRIPEEIEIVAHGNFPTQPALVPMQRLGYSPQQILNTCLNLLQNQRSEAIVPPLTEVEAIFEDKINLQPLPTFI